jgi:hypothetical protein
MKILQKLFGPRSKYVKNIPYTYEARVDELGGLGDEPVYSYYYSDTICGLLEYLDKNEVVPENVEIFEVYQKGDNKMVTKYCVDKRGHWLKRPQICKSLHDRYIGHVDEDHCDYRDRNRKGSGPY